MTTHEYVLYMAVCGVVMGLFWCTNVPLVGYLIPVGLTVFAVTGRVYTLQGETDVREEDQ